MEMLLMIAVVSISLAIIVQAGVLLSMYLMSRKLTSNINSLMDESRKLMSPIEAITANLKTTSKDLADIGEIARDEVRQVQAKLAETRETILTEVSDIREKVLDFLDAARETALRPLRYGGAIASGITAGIQTLLGSRSEKEKRRTPAA